MEITVCDIGLFNEKILIEPEMTCKDLKDKIFSIFKRDTSNCTICSGNTILDDHKKIVPSSSMLYVILDQNIEKIKSLLDFNHSFYSSSRFSNFQQYNSVKYNQRYSFLLNDNYLPYTNIEDSLDYEDSSNGGDNEMLYITDFNNNEDDSENSDSDNFFTETTLHNIDIDNEYENSDGDEYAIPDNNNQLDFVSQNSLTPNNSINTIDSHGTNHRDDSFRPHHISSLDRDLVLNDYFLPHGSSTPPMLSSSNLFPHQNDLISSVSSETVNDLQFQLSDEYDNESSLEHDNNSELRSSNHANENILNINLTPEENDIIRRICSENDRFNRFTIIQVFEACGRDTETTIQCLNTM